MISYPLLIVCALAGSAVGAWLGVKGYATFILQMSRRHKDAEV